MAGCTLAKPALLMGRSHSLIIKHGLRNRQGSHLLRSSGSQPAIVAAAFSTSTAREKDYKLVIVGGGSGGAAIANRFVYRMGKNAVAVIEPSDVSTPIIILYWIVNNRLTANGSNTYNPTQQ